MHAALLMTTDQMMDR